MNTGSPTRANPTQVNLWVDGALFTAIMLALSPALTGMAIHEWLSLALAVAAIVHLLLHWQWIVNVLRRFVGRMPGQARLNLALNLILFIAFTIVTFTGILISREALPLFGIVLTPNRTWSGLHRWSADLIVFIVGVHIALHWKWIWNAFQRFIWRPIANLGRRPQPQPAAVAITLPQEVE